VKCSGRLIGFGGKKNNGTRGLVILKTRRGRPDWIATVISRWHYGVPLQIRPRQNFLHCWVGLCPGSILKSAKPFEKVLV
jgi:hypothetical protein